jgi:hypothetical protein
MGRNRPDEDFAFEVVGHLLGAEVEPYDCCGRQNVVDALLHYADGRDDAVLEVSSIGNEDEARIDNVLGRRPYRTIAGLTKVWYVEVPADFAPKELDVIDRALLHCERLGIDQFPAQALVYDEQARALWARRVTAGVISTTTPAPNPRAYGVVRGVGGPAGQGSEPLVEELFDHLQDPKMQSKISKLAKPLDDGRPRDERHLFLIVRPTAFTFPVYDALAFGGPLPSRPPRLPDGVSQVWLASLAAGGIVRAVASNGWLRSPAWPSLWQRTADVTKTDE